MCAVGVKDGKLPRYRSARVMTQSTTCLNIELPNPDQYLHPLRCRSLRHRHMDVGCVDAARCARLP